MGKYVNTRPNDATKLNSTFGRTAKPSATSTTQPASDPLSQDTRCKCEKAAKESYICNQSVGFNRCITTIQESVQEQIKILQTEMGKVKSSAKAQKAIPELQCLTFFNQNVSFALGKAVQHLSDFIFM